MKERERANGAMGGREWKQVTKGFKVSYAFGLWGVTKKRDYFF